MLTEIIKDMIAQNIKEYQERRQRVTARAVELNSGWCASKTGRESLDKIIEPTWGKDDRPHAPFDGYLWENEVGEIAEYHGGSYLPYVTEFDRMDKPEYDGDHGWWKLRLTSEMLTELCLLSSSTGYIEVQSPYKTWDLEDGTKVVMAKVRAHTKILNKIQDISTDIFNAIYEKLNANKGIAPEGKINVTGRVVSVKTFDDFYGVVSKMTVRLENGSTAYGTLPKCVPLDYRGDISFTAKFTQAVNDNTHSFYKNPSKVEIK
ncbi:hypothetical protein AVV36_gp095 [Pectobacterium bacteriophage PM2]|uniref:Uncharacterized protein n=1 Tax=Pectobacterium bacteriophage PM2 TaxID=1429794 RepID=A0A0A0Q3E7_9CAUD|nr:hypothetical protein AVV36_gp095 [Pectobacterium bacteriophage PM2]AHY25057.1 hypothetical protein PM2_095 [Pectobacterium bacteriophage PM2]